MVVVRHSSLRFICGFWLVMMRPHSQMSAITLTFAAFYSQGINILYFVLFRSLRKIVEETPRRERTQECAAFANGAEKCKQYVVVFETLFVVFIVVFTFFVVFTQLQSCLKQTIFFPLVNNLA